LGAPYQVGGALPLDLAVLPFELEDLLMVREAYPWRREAFQVEEASYLAAQHPYCWEDLPLC
jgi:hypothetical protein